MAGNHNVANQGVTGSRDRGFMAKAKCSCGMTLIATSMNPDKARRKLNGKIRQHERWGK